MNTRARHAHIDTIKAIATIIVMMTHVLAYHLGEYTTWFLWNYSHFVVVGLVFCSAYLYADTHPTETTRLTVKWFFKRLSRLYIPYLIYLIFHAMLMNFFPQYFMGYGWQKTLSFFVQNLTLTGGVDFGWLPLLFIQLAIFLPILLRIARNKNQRNVYIVILSIFVCITTILRIPTQYSRLMAWIPWSLVAFLGLLFCDAEKLNTNRSYRSLQKIVPLVAGIWIAWRVVLTILNMPTSFDMHKYPPDISYLSYGAFFTGFFLLVLHRFPIQQQLIKQVVTYISKQSYQLFFIHFILLDLVMTRFRSEWIRESAAVILGTLCVSILISSIQSRFRKSHTP